MSVQYEQAPRASAENERLILEAFAGENEESPEKETAEPKRPETYTWVYELPMIRSFFLLFEVWRVFGIAAGIMIAFTMIIDLFSGGISGMIRGLVPVLLVSAVLMVISLVAYWIVIRANNGRYTVLFEMDEKGVDHIQIKTDKAKALDLLVMLAGKKTGNLSAQGAGMLSASGNSLYSDFRKVRKIRAYPQKNMIELKSTWIRNQVYAEDDAFEEIFAFIAEHCPDADTEVIGG